MGAMPINVLLLGSQQRGRGAHRKEMQARLRIKAAPRYDCYLGKMEDKIDKANFMDELVKK